MLQDRYREAHGQSDHVGAEVRDLKKLAEYTVVELSGICCEMPGMWLVVDALRTYHALFAEISTDNTVGVDRR